MVDSWRRMYTEMQHATYTHIQMQLEHEITLQYDYSVFFLLNIHTNYNNTTNMYNLKKIILFCENIKKHNFLQQLNSNYIQIQTFISKL